MHFIVCTVPPGRSAAMIEALLAERLIGGANIIPGLRSLYRWQGEIQDEPEELMLIETSDERRAAAMARLEALHPYEVPKIVALKAENVASAYLAWVREACDVANTSPSD